MVVDLRSDEQLLEDSLLEIDAFGVFYERHAEAVLAYLLYRTRNAERALDLTAETFAHALAGRRSFSPALGVARGWLFGIARHTLWESERRRGSADRARRRLGMQRLSFDDEELARVEALIDLEREDPPVSAMVNDLPVDQRDAVLARVVDERDYRDIAADLQVTEHTVRQRVSRGLAKLKERREHA